MATRFKHEAPKFKALIYGQPGAGKTRLSATAALDKRLAPALMLEAFGNPISLGDYAKVPDIISITDMEDFNPVYEWIVEGQPKDHPYCEAFELNPPYKTIIVDGLTEVQRFVMKKIRPESKTKVDVGSLVPALGFQGFGQLLGTMLKWATYYVGLDMNVILTSLEKTETDPRYAKPLLWGQSGNELCGYVHQVIRVTTQLAAPKSLLKHPTDPVKKDVTNNVGLFRATPQYYAKDQYGIEERHMTDPTLGKILDLIEQSSLESN